MIGLGAILATVVPAVLRAKNDRTALHAQAAQNASVQLLMLEEKKKEEERKKRYLILGMGLLLLLVIAAFIRLRQFQLKMIPQ